MCSSNLKRRSHRRISVWVLVFALMMMFISSTLMLNASASEFTSGAKNAADDMGNAAEDIGDGVGEAVSEVGDGMGEAMSDIESSIDDGKVNDTDGMIGNADSGADKAPSTDKIIPIQEMAMMAVQKTMADG